LTPYNRRACQFQKPIGVVATNEDEAAEMEQRKTPRGPQRKKAEPRASHSGQGLEVKKSFSTSGRGRSIFLDIPLYRSGDFAQIPTSFDSFHI
jgi:hypothetical protein